MAQVPVGYTGPISLKVYLSTDHVTPATGKTVAVVISKAGGAFGNPSAGATNATEISNGWYTYTPSATDSGSTGDLVVRGTSASCDDSERLLTVVNANTGGFAALPNAAAAAAGGLLTFGTGAGQINPDGTGAVPIAQGTAIGLAPTAGSTGEALLIMDSLSGRRNTATGGTATTITLDAAASTAANSYVGDEIRLLSGTGAGAVRTITGYNTGTLVATVDRAWDTNPVSGTTFQTIHIAKADVYNWNSGNVAATVGGVPNVNVIEFGGTAGTFVAGIPTVTFNNTIIATVTTVTSQLTAAQVATGIFQDTTAGDFTVAGSIGKALFTSAAPGAAGGHFIAGTNAATTVTTSFTTTFTGNLTGSVASVTGAVGSVTAAVTLPAIPTNWITSAGITAAALNGKGDWLLSSGYTAPSNAAILAAVAAISTLLGSPEGATVSADIATLLTEVAALPNSAAIATAILTMANGVTTGFSLARAMRVIAAAVAGDSSGVAAGSPVYVDIGTAAAMVSATASGGNRSGAVYGT